METKPRSLSEDSGLNERLAHSGLRLTPQRQHVFEVIRQKLDHPTADQVFIRARQTMPEISMATVYNCLDALVQCGLVRQVNLDRAATRFCPNMHDHYHFYCDDCGQVYDIDAVKYKHPASTLPPGFLAKHVETSIRGLCPDCAKKARH
jgi:Fur family peroxide stress response transcriptional regulator